MNELKYYKIPHYQGAGVYAIFNVIDMMVYVGETTNIKKRAHQHMYLLKTGKHPISKLQNDVNKNLRFVILKRVSDYEVNNIRIAEMVFILKMHEYGFRLYNKPCKFIDMSGEVNRRRIEESIALNVIYNYREDGIDEIKKRVWLPNMAHAKNENSKENRSFRNVKISIAAGKPAAFADLCGDKNLW